MSADNWTICPNCRIDDEEDGVTLREDYEFYGIETGVLHVVYQAYCAYCDKRYTFNRSFDFATNEEITR